MRISVSNLAWDINDDAEIANLLGQHGIDAIDVVPGKYFPSGAEARPDKVALVKRWWGDRGIQIKGLQSLLYGARGLNIFTEREATRPMLSHLAAVCRVSAGLGGGCLVFGSPLSRDRTGLSDEEAVDRATWFFQRFGDIAASNGVEVCLEPNPRCYGANFMTNSDETAAIVNLVGHPAIRMQLDTGALAINGEDPMEVIRRHHKLIGHVHASEPQLLPLGYGNADHDGTAAALRRYLPAAVVAVEMLPPTKQPGIRAIEQALFAAIRHYGDYSQ